MALFTTAFITFIWVSDIPVCGLELRGSNALEGIKTPDQLGLNPLFGRIQGRPGQRPGTTNIQQIKNTQKIKNVQNTLTNNQQLNIETGEGNHNVYHINVNYIMPSKPGENPHLGNTSVKTATFPQQSPAARQLPVPLPVPGSAPHPLPLPQSLPVAGKLPEALLVNKPPANAIGRSYPMLVHDVNNINQVTGNSTFIKPKLPINNIKFNQGGMIGSQTPSGFGYASGIAGASSAKIMLPTNEGTLKLANGGSIQNMPSNDVTLNVGGILNQGPGGFGNINGGGFNAQKGMSTHHESFGRNEEHPAANVFTGNAMTASNAEQRTVNILPVSSAQGRSPLQVTNRPPPFKQNSMNTIGKPFPGNTGVYNEVDVRHKEAKEYLKKVTAILIKIAGGVPLDNSVKK